MSKGERFEEKRLLAILFVGLFIILMLPLSFIGYFFFNVHSNVMVFDELSRLNEEVIDNAEQIDIFLQEVHGDVLFLSKMSSLDHIINNNKGSGELEQDFLSFANEKDIFHQIRYIDESGQEIVNIDSKEGVSTILSNLENKKDRYYFTETIDLELGEIFISPLDLNVENGKIENRGTEDDPAYIPVIRYATPVFDDKGNSKGIVIINIYAEHFLDHIHEEQKKGDHMFLIDHNGFYLSHPDFDKEFGFMFGNNETIYNDYPEIAKSILSNQETEMIELGDNLVSFRYIYPLEDITEIEERESHIEEFSEDLSIRGTIKELREDNFWILIDIEPREEVFSSSNDLKKEFLFIIISTIIIVGLSFIFFFTLISEKFNFLNKMLKKGDRK